MKRWISWLFNCQVKLKWLNGDYSRYSYSTEQAAYMIDHFNGYEYAEVVEGFFKGMRWV